MSVISSVAMLAGYSGSGRFSISWKCSTHLAACSRSVVQMLPFLSITWVVWFVHVLQSRLVILFTVRRFPRAESFWASFAKCSRKALLSLLAFLFTSRSLIL